MKIEVKFGKETIQVDLSDDATLGDLKSHLSQKTGILPSMQKLLGKNPHLSKPENDGKALSGELGLKTGAKLMLIGTSTDKVVEAVAESKETKEKRVKQVQSFPVPFWVLPPYASILADPYVEGKLDGGKADLALTILDLILSRINTLGINATLVEQLLQPSNQAHLSPKGEGSSATTTSTQQPLSLNTIAHPMLTFDREDTIRLIKVHGIIRKCLEVTTTASSATKPEEILPVIKDVVSLVERVSPKEWILLPAGWVGMNTKNTMYFLISKARDDDHSYVFVVVNTQPGGGLEYHPSIPLINGGGLEGAEKESEGQSNNKLKYQTCLKLANIEKSKMTDEAFWTLCLSLWMKNNDGQTVTEYHRAEVMYDVLLPWLVEKGDVTAVSTNSASSTVPPPSSLPNVPNRSFTEILSSSSFPTNMDTTSSHVKKERGEDTNDEEAAKFSTFLQQNYFETPQRSESSATKALLSAMCFLLQEFGMAPRFIKQLKFVLRYETFLKGAEELLLAAQRCDPMEQLSSAMTRLKKCGVDPRKFNTSLDVLFDSLGPKEFIKNAGNVILNRSFFHGKVVALYFSAAWCPPCQKVTPLLIEAYKLVQKRLLLGASTMTSTTLKGNVATSQPQGTAGSIQGFEVIWISLDKNQQEHESYGSKMPWCRCTYPCQAPLDAFQVTAIPHLLLFGPDGLLMTDKGVNALMKDPEARLFPNAPWTGASPFSTTDRMMFQVSCGQVAHDAVKKNERGLLGNEHLPKLQQLILAVKAVANAMPSEILTLEEKEEQARLCMTTTSKRDALKNVGKEERAVTVADAMKKMETLEEHIKTKGQLEESEEEDDTDEENHLLTEMPLASYSNCELLLSVSTKHYQGATYNSKLPNLGDLSLFKPPTSYPELDRVLGLASTAVDQLWERARFSGTSSRVAIQMQVIEFVAWLFTYIIPVPKPPLPRHPSQTTQATSSVSTTDGTPPTVSPIDFYQDPFPVQQQQPSTTAATNTRPSSSSMAPSPGYGRGGATVTTVDFGDEDLSEMMQGSRGRGGQQQQQRHQPPDAGSDLQFDVVRSIYRLMLSFTTAWQAVEIPTRAFDSERGLIAMAMLCVYDAVSRNTQNSQQCHMLAFLLNDEGGFYLSTTVCKATKKFSEVSGAMELNQPQSLPLRSQVLQYLSAVERNCNCELFDLRMPDKFEIRKYSHTVTFLRKFLENCGYEIMARGGMMGQQSEMEILMGWLCSTRSPLAQEHPEFGMLRDMVLLVKFLSTMEMRDAQLLRKKKQLDEFATWRISFDEDGPGRQMSAGWRTKPRAPVWELLMVRGRDMDIADVEVKGFGDRELLYGEGLVTQSPIDVARLVNIDFPTEDDLLHASQLPNFGEILSQEECEILLSCLTTSYMRIPLILDFFASQDRHTYLFSPALQNVLRATLFEPGPYLPPTQPREVTQVPMRATALQKKELAIEKLKSATAKDDDSLLLGTTNGLLLSELTHSPESVLRPLITLLKTITELGPSSVYSMNASYVLYLTSLTCDVLKFVRFTLDCHFTASISCLQHFSSQFCTSLRTLVKPLLSAWLLESEENNDIPTQCVIHTFVALLYRTLLCSDWTPQSHTSQQQPWKKEDFEQLLGSCAFVRVRHGFGLGMMRTQLALQEGDSALTAEEKLLRFLQAQGLDTRRVTTEQLEHGRRLMMSGGRRRAVFVHISSRFYSDTVRVPNLSRTDPKSTAEAKELRLPPVDVPEHALFALLQELYPQITNFFQSCDDETLKSVFSHILKVVLKDKDGGGNEQQGGSQNPSSSLSRLEKWALTSPGVYTAPLSGLVFHLQTCELFWRNDELKPVPDSMSHFADYESILGKDVLQCGLVNRTEHMHWIHIVGTEYDLIEWDASHPKDQGIYQPLTLENTPCAHCGKIARCWFCEKCEVVVCDASRCKKCRGLKPKKEKKDDKEKKRKAEQQRRARRGMMPGDEGGSEQEEEHDGNDEDEIPPIEDATFCGVRYNRPINIYEESPWTVRSERWVVDFVKSVFLDAYPMPNEMKFLPLMPEVAQPEEADDDDQEEGKETKKHLEGGGPRDNESAGLGGQFKTLRLIYNDEAQYPEETERNTWKEIVVTRQPRHLQIFNLVPHARKLHRSLVYSSNQKLALHSLTPLKARPRKQDTLKWMKCHAGEIKKRVQNESTLQILRHNREIGGREMYLPARFLQGLIPSCLLENFLFWHGTDDLIRGYPMNAHPWFSYHLEIHIRRPLEGGENAEKMALAGLPLSLPSATYAEGGSKLQKEQEGSKKQGGSPLWTSQSLELLSRGYVTKIVRRHDNQHTPIHQKHLQHDQTAHQDMQSLLHRTESSISGQEKEAHEETVKYLHAMFPHLSPATIKLALQQNKYDQAFAASWLCEDKNQALVLACEEASKDMEGSGGRRGSEGGSQGNSPSKGGMMGARSRSMDSMGSGTGALMDNEELENETEENLMLMNIFEVPQWMNYYVELLTKIEDASHILAWGVVKNDCHDEEESHREEAWKGSVTLEEESLSMKRKKLHPILQLHVIELPRLRAKFQPKWDSTTSQMRLFLVDHPGWHLASPAVERTVEAVMSSLDQCLLLGGASLGELALLVPSHEFSRMKVRGDPFSSALLYDRGSLTWQESVPSPFYLLNIHPSRNFLMPPSLSATLYLSNLLLAKQKYSAALPYVEACYVDVPFTMEEAFMFNLVDRSLDADVPDYHPDAHAIRLKMAHAIMHSPNKLNWPTHVEITKYFSKLPHVNANCRLHSEELIDLMKRSQRGSPIIKCQLEYWRSIAEGKKEVELKGGMPLKAGQPWSKLMSTPHGILTGQKLSRVHYKPPKKPYKDGELLKLLWEDELLTDEESGTNRQLGFFFLYLVKMKKLPLFLGTTDVTESFGQLATRYFHLKLARWGKESQEEGESEARPSFSMAVLGAMDHFPMARWPVLNDRTTLHLLARGTNVNSQDAQQTALPGFIRGLESVMRELYNGPMRAAQDVIRNLLNKPAKELKATSLAIPNIDSRIIPSNSSQSCLECNASNLNLSPLTFQSLMSTPLEEVGLEEYLRRIPPRGKDGSNAQSCTLPFNVSSHPLAQSHVAQDMISRLQGDMHVFAAQVNEASGNVLKFLDAGVIHSLFAPFTTTSGGSPQQSGHSTTSSKNVAWMESTFSQLKAMLQHLCTALHQLYIKDTKFVKDTIQMTMKLSNDIRRDSTALGEIPPVHVLRYALKRIKGSKGMSTFEWLCGALLSTSFHQDVQTLNPYNGGTEKIAGLVMSVMFISNRAFFASQALTHTKTLLSFLEACYQKLVVGPSSGDTLEEENHLGKNVIGGKSMKNANSGSSAAEGTMDVQTMKQRLHQLSTQLVDTLTAKRFYTQPSNSSTTKEKHNSEEEEKESSFSFDPRFLVFEYIFSILLRERQVEMINWFVSHIHQGQSRVQQMIMGQGKTTVVGPLLALILADGKTLVTQVMPTALLEQSRSILRKCFSVIVPKHIFTLQFDRSFEDSVDAVDVLYQKLKSAEKNRAIVVAAPECIKALFLKFVEQLHAVEQVPTDHISHYNQSRRQKEAQMLRDKTITRALMADALVPIFKLWSKGVLIMDEVDVLLHPLRSELNFPIGHKHPIDLSGPRWHLPIHILDAIFYHTRRCVSFDVASAYINEGGNNAGSGGSPKGETTSSASEILCKIDECIALGYRLRAIQREPHFVLLDTNFYFSQLRLALIPWVVLWLRKNLPGHKMLADVPNDLFVQFLTDVDVMPLRDVMHSTFVPGAIQILNLTREWLSTILPHVLSKINRVGFGVLQPQDLATAINSDLMPLSRRLMAVPFVAKDVPSRSSEFAHPDVVIGLTILAFRYEGLRVNDLREVLLQLKQDYSRQTGPREQRPASQLYNHWMHLAMQAGTLQSRSAMDTQVQKDSSLLGMTTAGVSTSTASMLMLAESESTAEMQNEEGDGKPSRVHHQTLSVQQKQHCHDGIIPLSQLQVLDVVQLTQLHRMLWKIPEVVHHYLCQHVFPRTMNFQQLKVSACGHELGSNLLFSNRIGFSGTPSNLLPLDLGDCSYEPGSDGRIVSVLSDSSVTTSEALPADWSPKMLLERIATASPSYHALIDTGALITNMDNSSVAEYLLEYLPPTQFEGVVFLDNRDRQMVLLRSNGLIVPAAQCGIALSRRFTFFDQIHTTGMDIKQCPTAVAVVTIGKDMVFRDYAQGSYRMRGIGKGQKIHLYLIPEVFSRIHDTLGSALSTQNPIIDVPAWLLLNAMRVEGLQFVKLSSQELANVYRKEALKALVQEVVKNGHLPLEATSSSKQHYSISSQDKMKLSASDGISTPSNTLEEVEGNQNSSQEKPHPQQTDYQRCRRFELVANLPKNPTQQQNISSLEERNQQCLVLQAAIQEFREVIAFHICSKIEAPIPFVEKLKEIVALKAGGMGIGKNTGGKEEGSRIASIEIGEKGKQLIQQIIERIASASSIHSQKDAQEMNLNTEVVHEQEAEEEQEQEAEQEEQRVSAFTRDNEEHIPWNVHVLGQHPSHHGQSTPSHHHESCFYPCAQFQVRPEQPKLHVPSSLMLSDNFFKQRWAGLGDRRLKNCIVFLEYIPNQSSTTPTSSLETKNEEKEGQQGEEAALQGAEGTVLEKFLDVTTTSTTTQENMNPSSKEPSTTTHTLSTVQEILKKFTQVWFTNGGGSRDGSEKDQGGRSFYAAISLAEGETLRWLIHHSPSVDSGLCLAVRIVSSSTIMDASSLMKMVISGSNNRGTLKDNNHQKDSSQTVSPSPPPCQHHMALRARIASLWYRFFNCDMFYNDKELQLMEQCLFFEDCHRLSDRIDFFLECLRLRRRHRNQWEDAPVAKLFTPQEEWQSLRALALLKKLERALSSKLGITVVAPNGELKKNDSRTKEQKQLDEHLAFVSDFKTAAAVRSPLTVTPSSSGGTKNGNFPKEKKEQNSTTLEEEEETNDHPNDEVLLCEDLAKVLSQSCGHILHFSPGDWLELAQYLDTQGGGSVSLKEVLKVLPCLDEEQRRGKGGHDDQPPTTASGGLTLAAIEAALGFWSCATCTGRNDVKNTMCDFCGSHKDGNNEGESGPGNGGPSRWQCSQCTYINDATASNCEMCGYGSAGQVACPEGYWVCSPEQGGCSKFNPNGLFYCDVCDRARPNLAALRF